MFNCKRHFFCGGRDRRSRYHTGARISALAVLLSVSSAVLGANWFFQPLGSVGAGYEQNVDLSDEDPTDTSRYDISVAARGGRLTERSEVVGSLLASFRRYPGNKRLDSDNFFATLDSAFLPTELDRLSLNLEFDRDTSRISELATTGNIIENVVRNAIVVGPVWERRLTERSEVGLGYTHTRVRFASNLSGLVDFDQDDIDVSYAYELSERLAVSGEFGITSYDPNDAESYIGYQASLAFSYWVSETLRGSLNVGPARIDSKTSLGGEEATRTASGVLYGFELSKQFERSTLDFSMTRGVVPTGSGEPLLQERVRLGYEYWLSPRLRFALPVAVFRNETIRFGGGLERDEERRIFFTTEPRLNWRVTEDLELSASYRYRYERFERAGNSADSNALFLSLSYAWPTEIPTMPRRF